MFLEVSSYPLYAVPHVSKPSLHKTAAPLARSTKIRGDYAIIEKNNANYIVQRSSLEVMHPSASPDVEARMLYVEMSGLKVQLEIDAIQTQSAEQASPSLVVWDVGLGAAFNAMAVIREREAMPTKLHQRTLHILSFENDLDSLRLVLEQKELFQHLRHEAPEKILTQKKWENKEQRILWEIIEGDFSETLERVPCADFILYDLFSPRTNLANWSAALFSKIFQRANEGCTLVTYSRATAVKSALLAAGFYVGVLPGIPPKEEHVIAWKGAPTEDKRKQLLSDKFLIRWNTSHKKYPCDIITPEEIINFSAKIESHGQWRSTLSRIADTCR